MDYGALARQVRLRVLEMVHKAGTSHIASNFSCIDFATVLYENLQEGDEVVWSKGWAAATIYYFLAKQGKIPYEDLEKFPNARYLGLAETGVPGVLVNGGSVGHGLPIAVGIALGKRKSGERGKVYCIVSDGELNEGSVWEAVAMAAHHNLDNLVVLVDANGWQAMGRTEDICNIRAVDVFRGFGWNARKTDGHDYNRIDHALKEPSTKPRAVIFNTVKGKGVSFMENALTFHYKNVDAETFEKAKAELV